MFRAAFKSRSRGLPHSGHIHDLTRNPLTPRGPLQAPHDEQVRLEFTSLTILTFLLACWPFHCSCALNMPQPESRTDLAILVFASYFAGQ